MMGNTARIRRNTQRRGRKRRKRSRKDKRGGGGGRRTTGGGEGGGVWTVMVRGNRRWSTPLPASPRETRSCSTYRAAAIPCTRKTRCSTQTSSEYVPTAKTPTIGRDAWETPPGFFYAGVASDVHPTCTGIYSINCRLVLYRLQNEKVSASVFCPRTRNGMMFWGRGQRFRPTRHARVCRVPQEEACTA